MSQQTRKPNADLLNTQTNAEENQSKERYSNEEIIKRELIPGSPFIKVTVEEGIFIALGENRLTDIYGTQSELDEYMDTWEFMIILISCVADMRQKFLDKQKN